eukprot:gene21750-28772_t
MEEVKYESQFEIYNAEFFCVTHTTVLKDLVEIENSRDGISFWAWSVAAFFSHVCAPGGEPRSDSGGSGSYDGICNGCAVVHIP